MGDFDFDPGEGWRQVELAEYETVDASTLKQQYWDGVQMHCWVKDPVPALPTAPFTVIRVTYPKKTRMVPRIFMIEEDGKWYLMGNSHGAQSTFPVSKLYSKITGFEVLSEPRGVE